MFSRINFVQTNLQLVEGGQYFVRSRSNLIQYFFFAITECSSSSTIISVPLPPDVTCYLSNTCTGIDCCAQVDMLGLSINAFVDLDPCNNTLTVGIEKFIYKTSILDIDFGTVQTFSMFGFANIR